MSRRFTSAIEKGSHSIDVLRLFRLAMVFDMSLSDLLDLSTPLPIDRAAA
jgi:transcriptional regulator with XRE-family HTH domain